MVLGLVIEEIVLLGVDGSGFSSAWGGGEIAAQAMFDALDIFLLATGPAGVGGLTDLPGLLFVFGRG